MKTKNALLLLALPLLLCACGTDGSSSSLIPSSGESSESGSSSPSSAPDEVKIPDYVYTQIKAAASSYRVKIREYEKVTKVGGGELQTNTYDYDIINDASHSGGTHHVTISGGTSTVQDYVKGSRGYTSIEGLNYKNEVVTTEVLDGSSRTVYEREFANPFLFLVEGDLSFASEGHYLLNPKKTQLFAKYLLNAEYEVASCEFVYSGEALTQILVASKEYSMNYKDANTNLYVPARLNYQADCRFSGLGTVAYPHVEPEKSKDPEKEAILKAAFQAMGDNFTVCVGSSYQGEEPNPEFDSYWYFTGEEVYHQSHIDDETKRFDLYYHKDAERSPDKLYLYDYDETNGQWIYNAPIYSASYNVDPQDYSYFLPHFAEMAPELFTYVESEKAFVCEVDSALKYLGNDFLGGGYKISDFTNGKGNLAKVYLNKNSTRVDKVVVGYYAVDSQGYDVSRAYTLNFFDVGTTVLPSFVNA